MAKIRNDIVFHLLDDLMKSYLVIGSADTPIIKFQNGGIVCLDWVTDDPSWVIKWAVVPSVE